MFPLKDNIPLARMPLVTIALLALNVLAYLLSIRHGGSFFGGPDERVAVRYGAIPYELSHPGSHCILLAAPSAEASAGSVACLPGSLTPEQLGAAGPPSRPATWATVFTSMFMHGSFLHLFGNMLFLAIFGPTVEDTIGRARFTSFYLLGGIVALGAQVLIDPGSTVPTLGASGAIAAVLGGYILICPRARVLTLVFIIFFVTIVEVPAIALLGFWFIVQLYLGLAGLASPVSEGGVAYFAHVGGFAFGLLTIRAFAGRRRAGRPALPVY